MLREIQITKKYGIKADDCAIIAQATGRFASDVFIIKGNKRVNAKSIMGIISLNIKCGDVVFVKTEGDDEEMAINKVESLLL